MADRSVSVFLRANVDGYVAAIQKAKLQTTDMARQTSASAKKNKQDWDVLGKGMLVAGGVIATGLALAAKASMDFHAQLALLKSLSGATTSQMKQLETAAKTTGAAFGFSAKQAAEAETELVKAGISVTDILSGGLQGALTLAADGQMDVAQATEIAASAMTQFGLKGKDIPHIADLLAAGADKALGSVGDLGYALSSSGTVAAQFGWSLEQTVGTLSEFAQNAQIGERGGTLLRQMLLQLVNPSRQAKTLMDQYGFSITDTNGNLVNSVELSGRLKDSFGSLTAAQRNHAFAVIFGSHAIQAANILTKDGADVNQQWVTSVNDSGFAAQQASGKMDSLAGDLTKLKASLQNDLIDTGDQAQSTLRGLAHDATAVADAYGHMSPEAKKTVVDLGLVSSAVLLAGGGFLVLTPRIMSSVTALRTLQAEAPLAAKSLGVLATAGTIFVTADVAGSLANYIGQASVATVETRQLADSFNSLAVSGQATQPLQHLFGSWGGGDVKNASAALKDFGINAYNALSNDWEARARRIQDFGSTLPTFTKQTKQVDAALAQMVQDGNADGAAKVMGMFTDAAKEQGAPVDKLTAMFPQYAGAVKAAGDVVGGAAGQTKRLNEEQTKAAQSAADLKAKLDALNKPALDLRSAQRAYQQAVDDATASIKKNKKAHGEATQAGRDNEAALDAQATSAQDLANQIFATTGSTKKFHASLEASRQKLIETAEKMGYSSTKAKALADRILAIPTTRAVKVTVTSSGLQALNNGLDAAINNIGIINNSPVNVKTSSRHAAAGKLHPATGGYVTGPGSGTSDSIPAMLSNGEFVIRASSVDKIGLDALHELNRFADGGLVGKLNKVKGYATGGEVTGTPDNSYISQLFGQSYSTHADVSTARQARRRATETLSNAEDRLHKLEHDGASHHQILEQEHRITTARIARRRATEALSKTEKSYNEGKKPAADRYADAAAAAVRSDGQFLKDLNTLDARGFGYLAQQLYAEGDDAAKAAAHQMVKWSSAKLHGVQANHIKNAGQTQSLAGFGATAGSVTSSVSGSGVGVDQGNGPAVIYVQSPFEATYFLAQQAGATRRVVKDEARGIAAGAR